MTDEIVPAPSFRPPSRQWITLGVASLALVGAGVWCVHWFTVGRFMIDTDNAYVRADVATVAPLVSGRIVEVLVADNQRVAAGQLLARIDERDYRARRDDAQGAVAAAEAEVAACRARIANLQVQSRQQQSVIAGSAATMAAGMADARKASLEAARQRILAQADIASAQALEAAQADGQRSQANLAAARASLAAEREHLPVLATQADAARADLDKAQGALKQARAALVLANLQLDRTAIRAATAGTVGQRSLRAGQYVEPGTPLLAIVPDATYVVANYKETQVDRVHPGQPARISVDAFGGDSLRGRVDSFAPASGAQFALLPPDNATGNFTKIVQRLPVRIRLDQGQGRLRDLRPGMSVSVDIDTRNDRR